MVLIFCIIFFFNVQKGFAGSIVGWGRNTWGQIDVPDSDDFIDIAAGGNNSLALKSDGSLVAWGDGPIDTPDGNNFVNIAVGYYHSLALKSDGALIPWRSNTFGLIDNTPTDNDFVTIAAGWSLLFST